MSDVPVAEHDEATVEKILSLGLLRPGIPLADALAAASTYGLVDSARVLYRHGVTSLALHRLSGSPTHAAEDLARHLTAVSSRIRERWRNVEASEQMLREIGTQTRTPWWGMKGISYRRLYVDPSLRDVGDVDVLVRSMDDAWTIAIELRSRGYEYLAAELPWFKREVRSGDLYGQVRLFDPSRQRLSVDIHAGPYSVRHCATMPLSSSETTAAYGPISSEEDLCATIANAAGDHFITAKLLNDILLSLNLNLNAELVRNLLAAAGLQSFGAAVAARFLALCRPAPSEVSALGTLVADDVSPEPLPRLSHPDNDARCEVTVKHAQAVAAQLTADPATRRKVVESAVEAYQKDHPLHVKSDSAVDTDLSYLNNWTCIRLVPVQLIAERFPGVARHGHGTRALP